MNRLSSTNRRGPIQFAGNDRRQSAQLPLLQAVSEQAAQKSGTDVRSGGAFLLPPGKLKLDWSNHFQSSQLMIHPLLFASHHRGHSAAMV